MTSNFIPVLLVMAVGLGAVLIVISIGINLYLQIKNKNYGELFFSQRTESPDLSSIFLWLEEALIS